MVYITLDELKEILPEILDQWIDEDDESWEWIFNEIEQKCRIGKKKKKIRKDVDELTKKVDDVIPKILGDFTARIDAQTKRIDGLSNKVSNLNDKVSRMDSDIRAAKLMAQTAKQRTDVDYTKCSKEKSDADVAQKEIPVVKKTCETCKYNGRDEHSPCIRCNIYNDKWEAKEVPVIKKMCATCRYSSNMDGSPKSFDAPPCYECNGNDKWEVKDDDDIE